MLIATAQTGIVDLSPLLNQLIEAAGLVVMALASWALVYLKNRFKIDVDDKTRAYLSDAIDNAIKYAEQKTESTLDPIAKVDTKNAKVAVAVDYVVAHVPDAVAHFGLTPDALARLVTAKLPAQSAA